MKMVWWMLSGSVLSCALATAIVGLDLWLELWLGMLGPLVSAVLSWIAMERWYNNDPAALTGLLVKAFAAKMAFFAIYIAISVKIGTVRPIPFIVGFLCYFVSLHALEAVGLRRLQSGALSTPPDSSPRV
jgi:hypothetical protein